MAVVVRGSAVVGQAMLSLLECGESGQPVVLLHGIPSSAELWRDTLPLLAAAGLRGLAPDLPGYGSTRLPADGDHSLAGAATLLARWLREQELAPVWLVGHDAGGAVAQIMAVEHGELVNRLTLVNSIADGFWPAPRARWSRLAARAGLYRPAAAAHLVPNAYMRHELRRGFAAPDSLRARQAAGDRQVFWDAKVSDPDGRAAFQRHLLALDPADTARVVDGLGRLTIPRQLVWGVADVFQPWAGPGRRLEQLLGDVDVCLLDGCGHLVPLDCPRRLCAALLSWCLDDRGAHAR